MRGKDKCKLLKQIRKQIADENDIPYVVEECKHKGECKGTCPKCEADLRMLERELSLRYRLGKTVAIAGIAAGMLTMTTGCNIDDAEHLLRQAFGIESRNPAPPLEGEALPLEGGAPAPEDKGFTYFPIGEQSGNEIDPDETVWAGRVKQTDVGDWFDSHSNVIIFDEDGFGE